ncbi:MAG TPA: alpha/beta hydrolase [Candidatus Cybelea sp.]|nr:alpha/beta hydrolase [Candidatus Cybelea sp.]
MIAGARLCGPLNGSARPPTLFVHGVGSTAAIWDYQLDHFGADRLCAAVELRGNGTLKPDPDPLAIDRRAYAQDVLAVADALEANRFVLVGCSLGGVVAFELWRRSPERVAAMVLIGAFARYPDGERYADEICAQAREMGDMRAFGELRAAKLGLPPARLRETIEQYGCKSVECFLASTRATWTGDYVDLLSTIDVPVLVAHGEHDSVAPLERSQEIASGIRGARLVSLPDAGHVVNADAPARFNAMLEEFLADSR